MKKITTVLVFLLSIIFLIGCEVEWETKFNKDGGGKYSMIVDMSAMIEMMESMPNSKDKKDSSLKDTVIDFSKILELKKDSIAKLSVENQKELKELEDLKIIIKADTAVKKAVLRIDYDFDNMEDLKSISKKLKIADIDRFVPLGRKKEKDSTKKSDGKLAVITDMLDLEYNQLKFTSKISDVALKEIKETEGEENPFSSLIKFKIRYVFPKKIKKVSNEDVRILSNFKGIEFNASVTDLSKNPNYLDVEVEFEE